MSSSPLQIDANFDWNADSGATSHMTPHSDDIVYSAGVGSVRFIPMTGGKKARVVEFT